MATRSLHALTFLAPNQLPIHRFVIEYLSAKLGLTITFETSTDYAQAGDADLCFICGLAYVLRRLPRGPFAFEAVAAPVLSGDRYGGRPIYFSDVIVRRDSSFIQFSDLRGHVWAYNEPESQSGYGITRYHLLQLGETSGFFGRVVAAAYHQEAVRMVARGEIDAAAIDSHVLALHLRARPDLAGELRVVDALGPSTIQPLTAAESLPASLKADIQAALSEMHTDPEAGQRLRRGLIDRFVPVTDADYADIRGMLAACEAANFLILK